MGPRRAVGGRSGLRSWPGPRAVGLAALLAAWAGLSALPVPARAQSTATPGLEVRLSRAYYDVSGSTAAEVLASMRESARPVEPDVAFAWTEAHTEYTFRYAPRGRGSAECRMTEVSVVVDVTVHLPRWNPRAASIALRQQWNRYLQGLELHEDGHVQIARRGGRRMVGALEGLRAPSCTVMTYRARDVAEDILRDVHAEQLRYDEETRHGRTQGVVWEVRSSP